MIPFFKQPYPYQDDLRAHVRFNVGMGIFVFLFLSVFQPFDIDLWKTDYKLAKLAMFGIVAMIVPTALYYVRKAFWPMGEQGYTVGKEIIWFSAILVGIAIGNLGLCILLGVLQIKFSSFALALLMVVSLGVFPIVASVLVKYHRYTLINTKVADQMDATIQPYHLTQDVAARRTKIQVVAENEKTSYTIDLDNLLYIESIDNYVKLCYHNAKSEVIRSTMKRIEDQLSSTEIMRCHRSFMINLRLISHISGNAQGYVARFQFGDENVPISRNYGNAVKEKLTLLL
jgi:hypothetical protein